MYRYQKWLIVSIALLGGALIFPIYVLYTALGTTLQQAVNTLPDYASHAPQTGGVTAFFQAQTAAQAQLLAIVIAIEAVLVVSFAVTMWYAIKCRSEDLCLVYAGPTPKS